MTLITKNIGIFIWRIGALYWSEIYIGLTNPVKHIDHCCMRWEEFL